MDEFSAPSLNMPARPIDRVAESKASVEAHDEPFSMPWVRKRRQQHEERRHQPDVFETEDGRQSESDGETVVDLDEPGTVIDIKA